MMADADTAVPSLSVVMPAFQAGDTIAAQLKTLLDQSDDSTELIVVDNGSADATATICAAFARADPRVRLVRQPRRGAPYALNHGIAEARSDRIVFCDADDVVGAGWIDAVRAALGEHAVVTGPLELDRLNDAATANSRGKAWAQELSTFDGVFPLVPSGNSAFHRDLLTGIGGFDPSWPIGYDLELAYRIWAKGVPVVFEPAMVVHYRYRADAGDIWRQAVAMGRVRSHLRRRLRRDGVASAPGAQWRRWLWVIRHLRDVATPTRRAGWLWVAGSRVGELRGTFDRRRA